MPKLVLPSRTAPVTKIAGAAALAVTLVVGACASDDKASGTTTTAPEEKISSDAEVAAGLQQMKTVAADVAAAGSDQTKAKAADAKLEPIWSGIEGTIKKNEPQLYTDVEDALALLIYGAKGEPKKSAAGSTSMATAIDSYLAKHPG